MATKYFGTDRFGGLNSQIAPHLLPADGLQVAENVDHSEHGAVGSVPSDYHLIQSISGGTLYGAGWAVVGGTSYYIYKAKPSGYVVYAYDVDAASTSAISTSGWGDGELQVIQGDGVAILTDGTANRFYDGTNCYEFGAPEATGMSATIGRDYLSINDGVSTAITNITESSGTITVSTGGIALDNGDQIWIEGVSGMTEINDAVYTVENDNGTSFDLVGVDGSSWSAYSSGGTIYRHACGLTGDYVYRTSVEITLPSGKVIESSLTPVKHAINQGSATETTVTLEPQQAVLIWVEGVKTTDVSDWITGDYTAGTDLTVSRRIYRSKLGDTEQAYLLEEIPHADVYDETSEYATDLSQDSDLGAQWLPSTFDAHDAPSTFSCGCTHAYRLYVAVGNEFYWSGLDGHGYFTPTDSLPVDGDITALVSVGDFLAIFSDTGAWIYDPASTTLKDLKVRYGVEDFHGVHKFDGRVWFANHLGLFVLDTAQFGSFAVDSVQSRPVSWPVDDEWQALDGNWSLGSTHDTLYINCKQTSSSKTFVLHVGDGSKWGTLNTGSTLSHGLITDRVNNVCLYSVASGGIYSIGQGSSNHTATIQSPEFLTLQGRVLMLKADLGVNASYTATVTSNSGETVTATFTGDARRSLHYATLEKIAGQVFDVQFVGTGKLYGYVLAVEEHFGHGF